MPTPQHVLWISDSSHDQRQQTKRLSKKNCCLYCKKMVSKITKHLEAVHRNEESVMAITGLPRGNVSFL